MTFFELFAVLDADKNLTVTKISNQNQGENNCTEITVSVPPEMADGFQFFLEFLCPQNKRYVSTQLEDRGEKDGTLLFACTVPSCVLQEEGLVIFQLIARNKEDNCIVYKSVRTSKTSFFVHPSVNACEQAYAVDDYFANYNGAWAKEALLRETADEQLQRAVSNVETKQSEHESDTNNPHGVTKEQLGLGNVQNTNDGEKRVLFATFAQCDEGGYNLRTTYAKQADIPTTLPASGGNADTVDGKRATDFATATQGAKADTAYQKPANGIPKTDLATDVQNALGLAEGAVQSLDGYATESFVKAQVSNIVNSAPETLDTLQELATALGNDPNFATTIATQLGGKLSNTKKGSSTQPIYINSDGKAEECVYPLCPGSETPTMNGVADVGSAKTFARSDHKHPSDASKVDKVDGKGLSTCDYTVEEKTKLASIANSANNYALPIAGANLGGIKDGGDILVGTDGTVTVKDDSHNHVISNVDGLQNALDDKAPKTTATTSSNGLMSGADKAKLDGIATGANNYTLPLATENTLGGVKSGGDVTIDEEGVISVNDNSHGHTIPNIDGLQVTLLEKVNKTELADYAKKTDDTQEITAKSLSTTEDVSGRDALFDRVVADYYYVGTGSTNLLAQKTGTSTTQTMSQKAITNAIVGVQSYLEGYVDDEIYDQLEAAIGDVNSVLDEINGEEK